MNSFICRYFPLPGVLRPACLSQSSDRRLGHERATKSRLHRQRRDVAGAACHHGELFNSTPNYRWRVEHGSSYGAASRGMRASCAHATHAITATAARTVTRVTGSRRRSVDNTSVSSACSCLPRLSRAAHVGQRHQKPAPQDDRSAAFREDGLAATVGRSVSYRSRRRECSHGRNHTD